MKTEKYERFISLRLAAAALCLLLIAGCGKTTTVKLEELETNPVASTAGIVPTEAETQVTSAEETEAPTPLETEAARDEQAEPAAEETESQTVSQPEEADETEPTARIYILNKSSKKIHYPSCSSVKKMSKKNKLEFEGTMKELKEKGYVPCGSCRPK